MLVQAAYDAVYFVGLHVMAGTPSAPLAHTYPSRTIACYRLDGMFVADFGRLAVLAGRRVISVLSVPGDDKTVMEAQAWMQNGPFFLPGR